MAKRVTDKDIKEMFEAYSICGSYQGVAAATGWSISTVRKYLNMEHPFDTVPAHPDSEFSIELPSMEDVVRRLTGKPKLSTLTPAEQKEVKEIQKGMII